MEKIFIKCRGKVSTLNFINLLAKRCLKTMGIDHNTDNIHVPCKVGGSDPRVNVSNSTDSILYFAVCSAIMGFAVFFAVLQIA